MIKYYLHFCTCGCGDRIEIKPHHKYTGIPKYLSAHHRRGKPAWNRGKPLNHKPNCSCCICKAKRDGTGQNNPMFGRHHSEDTKEKMKISHLGERNFNWKGGISNFPYPFEFNEELKESIRERDNHTCQLCDKTQEDEGKKLSIHHIDYAKENLDSNNLITLCRSCNAKVNTNRKYWTKFFKSKVKSLELMRPEIR